MEVTRWNGEPALLPSLARTHLAQAERDRLAGVLRNVTGWEGLLHRAVEHRVAPLLYAQFKSSFRDVVPAAVLASFGQYTHAHLHKSLLLRSTLPEILAILRDRSVEAAVIKGPVLAALAYKQEALRPYSDLDVLVHAEDRERAGEALIEAGFEIFSADIPKLQDRWLTFLHGNANGYVRDRGTPAAVGVDLHWALASRYFSNRVKATDLWDRMQTITLPGGMSIETLSVEDTLVFLCLHATKDGWNRLSHVCDVAELVRAYPNLKWPEMLNFAAASRSLRMVLLGLDLAHRLLDAPLPESVVHRIEQDAPVQALSASVQEWMLARERPGGARRSLLQLQVRDRMRDGIGAFAYQWYNAL